MPSKLWPEFFVALVAAVVGGVPSFAGSLAGVSWQAEDDERHMWQELRHDAVKEFLLDYAAVMVELVHYGDRRLPVPSLTEENRMAVRKHKWEVEGACARLLLVAPELNSAANSFRSVLNAWESAIEGREPYDRKRHEGFMDSYKTALGAFLDEARVALDMPPIPDAGLSPTSQ